MAVEVRENPELERYEALVDGAPAGFVQYHRRKDLIAFVHTEVDPAYEGQGVGSAIAAGALDDARAKGLVVLPFCPFFRGYIAKHPGYLDLVPEDRRASFDL